jgi:outer membrane receptor protein involved in Fe transport
LIERYETEPDFFLFRNRGRARLRGFEAEAQASLGWGISLESAFQTARGRALDGAFLDDVAPETVSLQLRKAYTVRDLFVQVRTAWHGEDTRPGPTEIPVPGYTLLDAAVGIAPVQNLQLRLSARNLLNERYTASQDVRTVSAPGRSAAMSVVVRFGR